LNTDKTSAEFGRSDRDLCLFQTRNNNKKAGLTGGGDRKVTVAKKIVALATSTLCLSAGLGVLSLVTLGRIEKCVDDLADNSLPGAETIGVISAKVYRFRGDAWKHIASRDPQQMAVVEQEMSKLKRELEEQMVAYERTISTPDDRSNFDRLKQEIGLYHTAWDSVVPLSRQSRKEDAERQYLAQVDPVFGGLRDELLVMQKWNRDYGVHATTLAKATSKSANFWTWVVLIGAVVTGVSFSAVIIRGLNASLRRFARDLSDGAIQVASAASQVAASSQSLAQGASEQAAALEETSASSQEVRSMADRNTEHAGMANQLVVQSGQQVEVANGLLNNMVNSMRDITQSSEKISRIIKIIDEIAFQTNILALNAAVEAARAGDAGMGFAVVADEVRNLAQRSAQAAKDTAALIEESISKSAEGKAITDRVATAIRGITEDAGKVKTLVDEVAGGSHEQTRGMNEVTKAITEMEHVTQRTAASAEESASAATELLAQSENLKSTASELAALVGGAK
jgi:methyl-accepting chemotaxis protein